MKVLVVGGGAREHALGWKLLQDDPKLELIAAPGNPGLAALGRCEAIVATDIAAITALARREEVAFTVIGPEGPLDAGIVDHFRANGLAVFGPSRAAARIETSKRFAKELMLGAHVPTASARTFTNVTAAIAEAERLGAPVVIKASGLAAGKGVIVAATIGEARDAIHSMLEGNAFGEAGHEVLVEEFMSGEEISVFALTDGTHVLPMIAAQDHKRVGEGDTGPNTGGMGSVRAWFRSRPRESRRKPSTVFFYRRSRHCARRAQRSPVSFTPGSCSPPMGRRWSSSTAGSATLRPRRFFR